MADRPQIIPGKVEQLIVTQSEYDQRREELFEWLGGAPRSLTVVDDDGKFIQNLARVLPPTEEEAGAQRLRAELDAVRTALDLQAAYLEAARTERDRLREAAREVTRTHALVWSTEDKDAYDLAIDERVAAIDALAALLAELDSERGRT